MSGLEQSISKAVDYLYYRQYHNGEFCCYISDNEAIKGWMAPDSAVFPTALIAGALICTQEDTRVDSILRKSTFFFECQMQPGGVWNYFTKWSRYSLTLPHDADDTACVSAVFRDRNIEWPRPDNKVLLYINRNAKGLFYTWFAMHLKLSRNLRYWRLALREFGPPWTRQLVWIKTDCKRNDVDAGVNANVLYYLGENSLTKPAVDYLINIIEEGREDECDKWYRSRFFIYYFLSRNIREGIKGLEPVRRLVIERIVAAVQEDGKVGKSVLHTALAVCSLVSLSYKGPALDRSVQYLLAQQRSHGEWERWAFYFGGGFGKMHCWGSEELTTAFCVEALVRYRDGITGQFLAESASVTEIHT